MPNREAFVAKMAVVFCDWVEEHDRIPSAEETWKMMIDAGMPDGTKSELEEAMLLYMSCLAANDAGEPT